MIADRKITTFARPVSGLPDRPELTADELKAVFDSNSVNEVKTAINGLVDDLAGTNGAANIGWGNTTVADAVLSKTNITAYLPTDIYHPATKGYVDNKVVAIGAGDMAQAVYDTGSNGIVDNAERLGGNLPSYYGKAADDICTVSHAKSGTVHTLTGSFGGMTGLVTVRFTASSAYAYGDTFALINSNDGQSYTLTAVFINGEALTDGFFALGSIVTAELSLEGKQAFFKSGGMPAGVYANQQFFKGNGTFTAPKSGKYHVTVVGAGGKNSYWRYNENDDLWFYGGGGGGGGTAIKDVALSTGTAVSITAGLASNASFGSYCTATKGGDGTIPTIYSSGGLHGSGGAGGTAAGGDFNYSGTTGGSTSSGKPCVNTMITSTALDASMRYTYTAGATAMGGYLCGTGSYPPNKGEYSVYYGCIGGVLVQWN